MENMITAMIMKVCEEHKIRLTPAEYSQLVIDYKAKFIEKIDVCSLIELADNVVRRNK